MALFSFGRPRPQDAARRRIADWVREAGSLGGDIVIKVNEIVCPDPACPGLETVILTLKPGAPTRACKVPKPLSAVTREDVLDAMLPTA